MIGSAASLAARRHTSISRIWHSISRGWDTSRCFAIAIGLGLRTSKTLLRSQRCVLLLLIRQKELSPRRRPPLPLSFFLPVRQPFFHYRQLRWTPKIRACLVLSSRRRLLLIGHHRFLARSLWTPTLQAKLLWNQSFLREQKLTTRSFFSGSCCRQAMHYILLKDGNTNPFGN